MSEPVIEARGQTVDEAVARALAQAGVPRESVLVEVVSQGALAVPGERITAAEACVRAHVIPDEVLAARRHLQDLLRLMDMDAEVEITRPSQPDGSSPAEGSPFALQVEGSDLGVLIGWRGESLRALQTVVNLMLSKDGAPGGTSRVIVDVARYRERRERTVTQMAQRLAADVQRSGRTVMLDPMPPYERRAVHMALASVPGVTSESTGVDEGRRVVIRPQQGGASPAGGTGRS